MLTFDEIYDAYEMANAFRSEPDGGAFINATGEKILVLTPEGFCDDEEEREECEKALETGEWIELPERLLSGQGNKHVYHFAAQHLSEDDYDYACEIFSHRRAYARWREFLRSKGLINEWHQYEYEEEARELKEWLNDNGIPFSDDKTQK